MNPSRLLLGLCTLPWLVSCGSDPLSDAAPPPSTGETKVVAEWSIAKTRRFAVTRKADLFWAHGGTPRGWNVAVWNGTATTTVNVTNSPSAKGDLGLAVNNPETDFAGGFVYGIDRNRPIRVIEGRTYRITVECLAPDDAEAGFGFIARPPSIDLPPPEITTGASERASEWNVEGEDVETQARYVVVSGTGREWATASTEFSVTKGTGTVLVFFSSSKGPPAYYRRIEILEIN